MFKKIIVGGGALIILGVSYYGISPLFMNTRIDEIAPVSKEEVLTPSPTEKSVMTDSTLTESPKMEESKPAIVTLPVIGTTGHPGSGTVRVINTETGAVIRYENFKTLNGPDLFVYLAKDLNAKEFVNLGELKATEGNVNYDVPTSVDVSDYKYIMVWCKQFGVLFNYAELK
jgi:hypothetical protein